MADCGGTAAAAGGKEEDDDNEWEDEGDWTADAEDSSPATHRKGMLPDGWTCSVGRGEGGHFVVAYKTDDDTVVTSKAQLRKYLKDSRPDLDVERIVQATDFSQKFARRAFIMGMEKGSMEHCAERVPTDSGDTESSQRKAETAAAATALPDTSRDEMIARTMQAAYDDEWRDSGAPLGRFQVDSEDSDPDWSDDEIGDVAMGELHSLLPHPSGRVPGFPRSYLHGHNAENESGAWRMRQAEQDEETAQDYDISCLEIKTVGGTGDGSGEAEEGQCAVCQEEWKEGDQQRVLPCNHKFHTACVDRWLREHKAQCPLCKRDVREEWEDEQEEVWDPVAGCWIPLGGARASGPDQSQTQAPNSGGPAFNGNVDGDEEGSEVDSNASWETVDDS